MPGLVFEHRSTMKGRPGPPRAISAHPAGIDGLEGCAPIREVGLPSVESIISAGVPDLNFYLGKYCALQRGRCNGMD